jgi:hypothetical protein
MKRYLFWLVSLSLLFPVFGFAIGEQYGRITGIVYAPDGAEMPGVKIVIESKALTGGPRTLLTKADGSFTFNTLAAGFYTLTAISDGFKLYKQTSIQVSVGKTSSIYIVMALAENQKDVAAVEEFLAKKPKQLANMTEGEPFTAMFICDFPIKREHQADYGNLSIEPSNTTAKEEAPIFSALTPTTPETLQKLPKQSQSLEEFLLPMPSAKTSNGTLLISGATPRLVVDSQLTPSPMRKSSR